MNTTISRAKKLGAAWLATLAVLVSVTGAGATPEFPDVATSALTWMRTQQQPDGSFLGFGAGSTVDAALAIVAARQDIAAYAQGGNTPTTFLQSKAADLAKTPGGAGKLLVAVEAMGMDGKNFGGVNLVDVINASYSGNTGQYGKDAIGHAFAMLGLKAAGQPVPSEAAAFLRGVQTPEGGWAFTGEAKQGAADTNTTSVAVQALLSSGAGAGSPEMAKAKAYLKSQKNQDGGYPYQQGGEFGSESDVNSTAYVTQALVALGEYDEAGLAKSFMRSMQKPNGALQWKPSERDDNAGATYQAVPALLDATFITPVPELESVGTGVSAQPGMPTTGAANWAAEALAALAAFAALALGAGVAARRWSVAR